MDTRQNPKSLFEDFLEGLRTEATRINYGYGIRWVLGDDPDSFVKLAKADRDKAEQKVVGFIRANRDRVASATIVNPIMAVRSFLDYNEVQLNWKKLRRELPVHQKVAMDRAPTVEEIRKLLSVCDPRMKAVVLVMASSGIRVGAFDFLRLGHLRFLDGGAGALTVYAKTPDQYNTFVSPEAASAVKDYLALREGVNEKLNKDSPLVRDKWDFEDRVRKIKRSTIAPDVPTLFDSKAIRNRLGVLWVKAGIRSFGIKRGEFQQAHGFRKWFKVRASKGVARPEVVECLMGHKANYFKPTFEELEEEYLKAEPYLTISESMQLKQEIVVKDKEHESEWTKARLENLELKERVREMEGKQDRVMKTLDFLLRRPEAAAAIRAHSLDSDSKDG